MTHINKNRPNAKPLYRCKKCNVMNATLNRVLTKVPVLRSGFAELSDQERKEWIEQHRDSVEAITADGVRTALQERLSVITSDVHSKSATATDVVDYDWWDEDEVEAKYHHKPEVLANVKANAPKKVCRVTKQTIYGLPRYSSSAKEVEQTNQTKRVELQHRTPEPEPKKQRPDNARCDAPLPSTSAKHGWLAPMNSVWWLEKWYPIYALCPRTDEPKGKAKAKAKSKAPAAPVAKPLTASARKTLGKLAKNLEGQMKTCGEWVKLCNNREDQIPKKVASKIQLWLAQLKEQKAMLDMVAAEDWKGDPAEFFNSCSDAIEKFTSVKGTVVALLEGLDNLKSPENSEDDE